MEKEYKARAGNRIVAIIVGLLFLGAGALVVTQGKLIGLLIALIGAGIIWAGLRPNKIIIGADGIEMRSAGKQVYPYSAIRRVRMVARRIAHRSQSRRGVQVGEATVRVGVARTRYKIYPEIQIEGDFKAPLILSITYNAQLTAEDGTPVPNRSFKQIGLFDTQPLLNDILARLPSDAEVDAAVQSYAATGSPPDVSMLPIENPVLPFGLTPS